MTRLVLRPASLGLALLAGHAPAPSSPSGPALGVDDLPAARVELGPRRGELVIELAPVDLPAGASHHGAAQPPVAAAVMPVSGAMYAFHVELVDERGRRVPDLLLHHFNFIDPDHRELFLPIARRVLASGGETGSVELPWVLIGAPFERGQRLVANAMLHNPTGESYRGVRTRLVVQYTPAGRPWPLFRAYPWQLDVAFPVGDKSFDLPPGRSEKSYEASPAVPGKILGMGGHVHDYAVSLEFSDVTAGRTIWRAEPARDAGGRVVGMPRGTFYGLTRVGVRIVPSHRYRVRVVYDNPTGAVIASGGMGVVGGVFVPDRDVQWPGVDARDSLYQRDLRHAMRVGPGAAALEPAMPHMGHHD